MGSLAMSVAFGVRLCEETLEPGATQGSQRVSCYPRHSKIGLEKVHSLSLLPLLV